MEVFAGIAAFCLIVMAIGLFLIGMQLSDFESEIEELNNNVQDIRKVVVTEMADETDVENSWYA